MWTVFQRGAKSIYVLRGDVSADSLLPPTAHYDPHDGRHPGIVYSTNDTTLFPALTHFGCSTVRPRTNTDMEASRYAICTDTKAVVATHVQCGMSQNVAPLCDEHVPGVTLQDGVFAHAQLSGAVFHEDAFWAIPLTRSEPYDDVGWTLGVQRLLWLIGKRLHVDRCTHSKRTHNSTFRQLFRDRQLANWKCTASTFKQCISDVIHHLSKARSFGGSSSGVLTLSWLVALSRFGYKFPKLVDVRSDNCRSSRPLLLHAVSHTASVSGRLIPVSNLKLIGELYNRTCRGEKVPAFSRIDLARPWMQFSDVLLVVVFNNPLYSIIPHLELLYRPFFPHILYCGPTPVDRRVLAGYRVSFVAYGRTPDGHLAGAFSYRCVSLAVAAGYRVAGFLVAADDLLLQLHTLQSFSRRAPWFLPASEVRTGELRTLRECRLGMCDSFAHWVWWRDYKAATVAALAALRDSDDPRLRACHDALVRRNGAEQRPNGGFADVYYVPRHLAAHFARLADVFLRHDVFVEIAVPTVFRCVAPPGSVEVLRGEALSTDATRDEVWRYFQTKYMVGKAYLHPTKWSRIATSPALNSLYCSKVLPFFHDRFARIDK